MECKTVQHNVIAYIENTLPEDVRSGMERHISHCSDCHALVSKISESYGMIDREKEVKVNPFLFTRIEQKLYARKEIPFYVKVLRPALIAASIIIGVLVGMQFNKLVDSAGQENITEERSDFYYFRDINQESVEAYLMQTNE